MAEVGNITEDKDASASISADYKLILHAVPPAITIPSGSPFVLKLITYFRIAGIQYTIDTNKPFGPKGKTPWITFNGQTVDDSQLIIEFLNKTLKIDLWGSASKEEKAVGQFTRTMLENHTLLGLAEWRWVTGINTIDKVMPFTGIKLWGLKFYFGRRVKNSLVGSGYLLHTPEQRMNMIRQDFTALSDYLGDKNYFLGDHVTEIDATVFGVLAQYRHAAPGSPFEKMFEEEYKNLKSYCERVKVQFWPDWDSLLHKTS